MTYACVIHVCLDVALREGDLRPSVIESKNAKTSLLVYIGWACANSTSKSLLKEEAESLCDFCVPL